MSQQPDPKDLGDLDPEQFMGEAPAGDTSAGDFMSSNQSPDDTGDGTRDGTGDGTRDTAGRATGDAPGDDYPSSEEDR